jgi:hypothetical protein
LLERADADGDILRSPASAAFNQLEAVLASATIEQRRELIAL